MSGSNPSNPPDWVTLEPGERIRVRSVPSNNLMLAALILATFTLLITSSVIAFFIDDVSTGRLLAKIMIVVIVGILFLTRFIMSRYEYLVTDQRVCQRTGILSKKVNQIESQQLDDVFLERSVWQRWFSIGGIRFVTNSDKSINFLYVGNPADLYMRVVDSIGLDVQ